MSSSHLFLISLLRDLPISLIFSENQLSVSLIFPTDFLFCYFISFWSDIFHFLIYVFFFFSCFLLNYLFNIFFFLSFCLWYMLMCVSLGFFLCVSYIWISVFLFMLGKFSAIILSNTFSAPFCLFSPSRNPIMRRLGCLILSQTSLNQSSFNLFFLLLFCLGYFHYSLFQLVYVFLCVSYSASISF